MNYKRKSRRRFFLLMHSRTPPISSEFQEGGGLNTPNPPPRYATVELHNTLLPVNRMPLLVLSARRVRTAQRSYITILTAALHSHSSISTRFSNRALCSDPQFSCSHSLRPIPVSRHFHIISLFLIQGYS